MRLAIVFLVIALYATPACAQNKGEAQGELSHTLSQMKDADERQQELDEKTAKVQRELKALQQELASLATQMQSQEKELTSLEEKLAILEEQKSEKTKALEARKAELSAMISAMIKLRQVPPEAVIAMPGKLEETLATARALGIVTHAIEDEAESLKQQLHELEALEDKINASRTAITAKKAVLESRQKELASQIKQRNTLQAALLGKQHETKERLAQLTAKSQTMQELLDSLEKTEVPAARPPAVSSHNHARKNSHRMRDFDDAYGELQLPPGKLISRYGSSSLSPTYAKGIVLATPPQTRVLSPWDGEVVYAGPFRDYGQMVIIRHSDNYHTLLAGMDDLDCTSGQFLLEGEPIGAMGKRPGTTRLYLELRKDGKPQDPLPWFAQ